MSNNTINIDNVGPIQHLEIPIPEGGGVVVLRGRNGTGKTTAINAAQALITGEGNIATRDGAEGAIVEGLGCRVTFGRGKRRTGQLTVSRLDGGSISAFVEPGIKDPERADVERVKQLCSLARVQASWELFVPIIGPELQGAISEKTRKEDSLPEMMASAKRDLQAYAREQERQASLKQGESAGLGSVTEYKDDEPYDEKLLADKLQAAARAHAAAEATLAERKRQEQATKDARTSLDAATAAYTGPKAIDAKAKFEASKAEWVELSSKMKALEAAGAVAKATFEAAQAHEKTINDLNAILSQTPPALTLDVDTAKKDFDEANAAVARGGQIRDARNRITKSFETEKEAKKFATRATTARNISENLESVLNGAISSIAPSGLEVVNGRLVLQTPRGKTLLAELSEGEKVHIALDVAIDAGGDNALIPIEQSFWEGLDPINRAAVATHAKTRGAVVLTAECDADALRAEVF